MPSQIPPSMRKVLDEIAANKNARDAAAAREPDALPGAGTSGSPRGSAQDDEERAHRERLEAHLQGLREEATEQTRLLREILARLPTPA